MINETQFILRVAGVDPLTRVPYELAFQFTAVDGPKIVPPAFARFTGRAVRLENIALNRVTLPADQAMAIVLRLQAAAIAGG